MQYQHSKAIPEEHNSSKPAHIPPNKDGRMQGDLQLTHRIGSSEKLAALRVSSEHRVFCIGEYVSTHLWSQPEIQK